MMDQTDPTGQAIIQRWIDRNALSDFEVYLALLSIDIRFQNESATSDRQISLIGRLVMEWLKTKPEQSASCSDLRSFCVEDDYSAFGGENLMSLAGKVYSLFAPYYLPASQVFPTICFAFQFFASIAAPNRAYLSAFLAHMKRSDGGRLQVEYWIPKFKRGLFSKKPHGIQMIEAIQVAHIHDLICDESFIWEFRNQVFHIWITVYNSCMNVFHPFLVHPERIRIEPDQEPRGSGYLCVRSTQVSGKEFILFSDEHVLKVHQPAAAESILGQYYEGYQLFPCHLVEHEDAVWLDKGVSLVRVRNKGMALYTAEE